MQANRGEFGDDERKGQKEITLKADVDPKIRSEVYKSYLMYTMSGEGEGHLEGIGGEGGTSCTPFRVRTEEERGKGR